ncbi:MAG: hypothetical protein V1720_05020 [bacterium]
MERKEFLKAACTFGICSCAGMSMLSSGNIFAAGSSNAEGETDWRIGFMQKRFANLIKILDNVSDPVEKKKILEDMGRGCANESKDQYTKFIGNPEGMLEVIKSEWAENTEYDKEKNRVRIIGKKMESCFCPFVDSSLMPKEFCNCSMGYNKQMFETIFEKNVNVSIEESKLYGGERCSFIIDVI